MIFISGGEERRDRDGEHVVLVDHVFRGAADTSGNGDIWARDVETPLKGDWVGQLRLSYCHVAEKPGNMGLCTARLRQNLVEGRLDTALVLCVLQCACMVGTVVLVELALRRNFYDDGRRKEGNAADLRKSEPF